MNLMTSEGLRPNYPATSANTSVDILFYASAACELGQVLVARSAKGVCAILLGDNPQALKADLTTRFPKATPSQTRPAAPSLGGDPLSVPRTCGRSSRCEQ
jgi:methylated-DNA-[protein]-cysteine S-methyltransferase/AraC family transcriptional regulator of adaptative response/methylated-DNA-[protein]-cysteine methyltransferase